MNSFNAIQLTMTVISIFLKMGLMKIGGDAQLPYLHRSIDVYCLDIGLVHQFPGSGRYQIKDFLDTIQKGTPAPLCTSVRSVVQFFFTTEGTKHTEEQLSRIEKELFVVLSGGFSVETFLI